MHLSEGVHQEIVSSEETPEIPQESVKSKIRRFESGATRHTAEGKYEYARFMDPRVIKTYAAYMHRHRMLPGGEELREPDNWKKGIPRQQYMDSLWRHVQDLWELHEYGSATRPEDGERVELIETLCAIMFNAMGYLFEALRVTR